MAVGAAPAAAWPCECRGLRLPSNPHASMLHGLLCCMSMSGTLSRCQTCASLTHTSLTLFCVSVGVAWQRAEWCYRAAARVYPASGNPWNQLAVMAFFGGDELRSVYCYFRGLSTTQRFVVARANLMILFEQNRARWVDWVVLWLCCCLLGGWMRSCLAMLGCFLACVDVGAGVGLRVCSALRN